MTRWLALSFVLLLATPAWGQSAGDWTNSFEASPADGDPISAGAGKIRGTRDNTRDRSEVDTCFGAQDGDGCVVTDDGRLREGAARAFFVDPAPTVLNAADNSAAQSTALDDGRLYVHSNAGHDEDGDGQPEGGRLFVWDETDEDGATDDGRGGSQAWENVVALGKVDYAESAITANDLNWFNDDAWYSYATAPATAPGTCDVTVPEEGNWRWVVMYNITLATGDSADHIAVRLCNATVGTCHTAGGGTVLSYQGCEKCGDPTNNNGTARGLTDTYIANATNNETTVFDLEVRGSGLGGAIGDINTPGSVADDDPDSWLRCWVEPRI